MAVGDDFVAEAPDGGEVELSVIEVHDDHVLVDANHPLAGVALRYHVHIQAVRAATESEIESAAADLDEAHEHVHGPDCDHTHDHVVLPGLSGTQGMQGTLARRTQPHAGKKAN